MKPPNTWHGGTLWCCKLFHPAISGDVFFPHSASAPTPPLAIARACAVLVARGVTREEVEDV